MMEGVPQDQVHHQVRPALVLAGLVVALTVIVDDGIVDLDATWGAAAGPLVFDGNVSVYGTDPG